MFFFFYFQTKIQKNISHKFEKVPILSKRLRFSTYRGHIDLHLMEIVSKSEKEIWEHLKSNEIKIDGFLFLIDFISASEHKQWLSETSK